ncbi:50S ribosomal protein L15 [Bifidobacterium actinocoloniiforme DSM 22766]|uniref:Large ribosomal subunit protein uL15 n=1 Tax=Bifidobacterium actinocoloniiforme DSM 22766 TaxID=1437605 RepID=A0A086YYR6_9BIFI|nr:50S ribosomal protein L15 [Bifidobacterium actinocoloniiforme]AKV55938.1 50S ribosomal protein L15 [Bifidobacterium actinocoloniiforme DSM 22766]KFI39416.1 50S ribosomal protein L15 [Bifidobacterium actinocoloniiforme DSM 22766]
MASNNSEQTEQPTILRMHDLHPAPGAKRDRIRVGRGEGSKGKTSGRGMKGTKARYQVRPGFEGGQLPLYMRLPKLRGFKSPFKKQFQVVNLGRLSELFPQGGEIDAKTLAEHGAVRAGQPVKVLGDGEAKAAFVLKGVKVSASAKTKVEAAGGSVSED